MSSSKGICASPRHARARQRGAVVLLLLLFFLIFSTYALLKALNAGPSHLRGARQRYNAEVLQRARDALVGYAAAYRELTVSPPATKGPGYLPCPDRATDDANAIDPARIDPDKEGMPSSNCGGSGLKLGRFPWRYLGTGDLRDASGERLWYAVSDNFRFNSGAFPLNSATPGTLCVDHDGDAACAPSSPDVADVVAVIIAPGESLAGQNRSPLPRDPGYFTFSDYLEGDNATPADNRFAITSGEAGNDQLLAITRSDLMRAVEARVSADIREISGQPSPPPDKPPLSWLIANGWPQILAPATR